MPESLNTATRQPYAWTELFRCFQVALDPRKLLVAAIGIMGMAFCWYVLSAMFYYEAPDPKAPVYDVKVIAKEYEGKKDADGKEYTDAFFNIESKTRYKRDYDQWAVRADLASPHGGKLRTLPWFEDRGPNPYTVVTSIGSLPSSLWVNSTWSYFKAQLPTMVEPLTKLLLPVIKLADENASTATRVYLMLCLFSSVAIWAFCGGIITRIAAVQLSGKDRVSVGEAFSFVCKRYLSYVLCPLVPLGIIGAISVGIMILGFVALLPIVGDVLYILIVPLVILGGIIMTVLVIGLVGYPLMYSTLSVEGSDTFDALARSYNYVFQAPWTYAWNCIVAIVYGAVVTFFVIFVCSLMVYLGKWALIRTPFSETTNQRADYLFANAPQSFGWQELLLQGSPIEKTVVAENKDGRTVITYANANPQAADAYMKSFKPWNYLGMWAATFWVTLVFLLMLGFSYSFFWSAAVMIYLLMRKTVDDVDLDDVYIADEEPLAPVGGRPLPTYTSPVLAPSGATSLPTVPAPATPAVAPVEPAPVPPAPVPVVPPTSGTGSATSLEIPKLEVEKK